MVIETLIGREYLLSVGNEIDLLQRIQVAVGDDRVTCPLQITGREECRRADFNIGIPGLAIDRPSCEIQRFVGQIQLIEHLTALVHNKQQTRIYTACSAEVKWSGQDGARRRGLRRIDGINILRKCVYRVCGCGQ